jgi:hypothetical protein
VLNNIKKGTSGINITGNGNIFVNVDKTVSGYDGAGVSINGDITAKTLTINADNPNGRNDKGIAAGYGSDITITATDSVNITSGDIGIHTEGDGTPKTTVTINTKDLMITSTERSAILNSYTNDVL